MLIFSGACGLGASIDLSKSGLFPLVLEAKGRYGGRIREEIFHKNLEDNPNNSYITIQLGANWIHGLCEKNPCYSYARAKNMSIHRTSSDDEPGDDVALFDYDFSQGICIKLTTTQYERYQERYDWIKMNFVSDKTINLQNAFERLILLSEQAVDPISMDLLFGSCSDMELRCLNWFFDRIAIDLCAPLDEISSCYYEDGESDGLYGEGLVEYWKLLNKMVEEQSLDIHYNTVVERIIWNAPSTNDSQSSMIDQNSSDHNTDVIIECQNGKKYRCQKCLVTLPVGKSDR